jgi:hypothetical protein
VKSDRKQLLVVGGWLFVVIGMNGDQREKPKTTKQPTTVLCGDRHERRSMRETTNNQQLTTNNEQQ